MTKSWAISIGINHYEHHPEYRLKYTTNDARHVSDFLTESAGFPESQVILCLGEENNKGGINYPTCSNLMRLLNRDLHPDRVGIIDRFWFFFSGHGISKNGRDYLIVSDSLLEDVDLKIALSVDEITKALRRHKEAEIILILDACRIEGGKGQSIRDIFYEGVTTIFSCKPYESSWEIDEPISQGAFTYALLQNFRQQINGNYLTIEQIERDLQQKLQDLNKQYGKLPQTPHIRCESARKAQQFLFQNYLPEKNVNQESQKYQVDHKQRKSRQNNARAILALKNSALKAEKACQFESARKLWLQILADFPSEKEEYIKAVDRISMRLASQPLLIKNSELATQSPCNFQTESIILPASQQETNEINQHNQRLVIPYISNTQSFEFEVITVDANGREINRHQGQAQFLIEELNDAVLEMVVIPGGTFLMGSSERKPASSEIPARQVKVEPFLLSRYPVTKGQWREIARLPKVHQELKLRPSVHGSNRHPVVEISWNEAIEFCDRLTQSTGHQYRLPTEAEWEYACRAGTTTPFHFGATITHAIANYDADKAVRVGSLPFTNAFGLSDLHGNVWEWCQDNWHDNYNEAPTTGIAWLAGYDNQNRLIRGGSWRNEAGLCRSAARMFDNSNNRSNNIGFRIARSL